MNVYEVIYVFDDSGNCGSMSLLATDVEDAIRKARSHSEDVKIVMSCQRLASIDYV
jgi:hypothetical protein